MTAPRGSGAWWNEIFEHARERMQANVDALAGMMGASGYPMLTEPVTLHDLRKMPPEQARAVLLDELARTTRTDPRTGAPVIARRTQELIAGWLEHMSEAPETIPGPREGLHGYG